MSSTPRLLAALSLAFVLAACSPSDTGSKGGDETRTIAVRMTDELRFDPADISVTVGETINFEVTNDGQGVHEFLIGDEAAQAAFEAEMASGGAHLESDAGVSVDPGQTASFEYAFEETGTELLAGCHEPGHYDAGMVASITVSE